MTSLKYGIKLDEKPMVPSEIFEIKSQLIKAFEERDKQHFLILLDRVEYKLTKKQMSHKYICNYIGLSEINWVAQINFSAYLSLMPHDNVS